MSRLVDIILFSSSNSLDQIKGELERIDSWTMSSYAHAHRIELYGAVAYERWGGRIYGELSGTNLELTIEGRNEDTACTCYRLKIEYPAHIWAQLQRNPHDESIRPEVNRIDERVKELITQLNGVILDDQD